MFSMRVFSGMKRGALGVSVAILTLKEASMHKRMLIQAATALVALQFFAVPVFAAGSGGGTQTTTQCKKGEVWDKKKQKCVAPQEGMLDDDSIYEAGHDLPM